MLESDIVFESQEEKNLVNILAKYAKRKNSFTFNSVILVPLYCTIDPHNRQIDENNHQAFV
jgi:hypothetical protein